jgi:hypothetical protein
MSSDGSRECKATDGLYSHTDSECQNCYVKYRKVCQVFSLYNGLREIEYYAPPLEEKPISTSGNVAFIHKLLKSKGGL